MRSIARSSAAVTLLLTLIAVGCAGTQRAPDTRPEPAEPTPNRSEGIYHTVEPGQTLWRIARLYGVELDHLAQVNRIEDPTRIEAGARLWIPGAEQNRVETTIATTETTPTDWVWPVANGRLVSRYGEPRGARTHRGLDISGRHGAPVRAARAGTVRYSGSGLRGYGKTVILDHGNGWRTLYAHNSRLAVRLGERVRQGQVIARVGKTGNATGDHCHFELRKDGVPVDPTPMVSESIR